MGVSLKQGRVAEILQAHILALRPEMVIFVCLNLICYVNQKDMHMHWEEIKWKGKKNDAKFTGHYA